MDLFEINEAFAVVAMAAQRDFGIPRDILNVNGGACALGHPIGATGARLIVTLLHALERHGALPRRGLVVHRWRGGHRHRHRACRVSSPSTSGRTTWSKIAPMRPEFVSGCGPAARKAWGNPGPFV